VSLPASIPSHFQRRDPAVLNKAYLTGFLAAALLTFWAEACDMGAVLGTV
jgi:hypothetical protein